MDSSPALRLAPDLAKSREGMRPTPPARNAPLLRRLAGALLAATACQVAGSHPDVPDAPRMPFGPDSVQVAVPVFLSDILASPSPAPTAGPARPAQAEAFELFAPRVGVRWDEHFLFVESNGIPAHGMMVGITAWQQQVPMPQSYFGANAWRIPLNPVPAKVSQTIRNHFLRGAIAIAADGIPIFNPQNNRGEISAEIGELDQWGGHCGRSDDYHYHVVPLHLQKIVGPGRPLAYALDGYPIFGLTEPDGSAVGNLDENNGHSTPGLGYHYHASTQYPYVIGGFHGEVVERGGQVDPQPRAQSVRPAQPPLRGARITGFTASDGEKTFALHYTLNGKAAAVNYSTQGGNTWKFQFIGTDGSERDAIYSGRDGQRPPRPDDPPPGGGARGPRPNGRPLAADGPGGGDRPPPPDQADSADRPPRPRPQRAQGGATAVEYVPKRTGSLVLHSSAVANGGELPKDYTGDGSSATPPLDWSGAPPGTKAYAVIMHHIDPEGLVKWYWTLYNIPAEVRSLPRNVEGVGSLGTNSINDRIGYAPPHSQGPGPKTYIITLYALSAPVRIDRAPDEVNRAVLLAAIKDLILDSAEMKVVYTRPDAPGGRRQNRRGGNPDDMPPP